MNIQFDDLPWHDAVLLTVDLDRRDPGNRDEVAIEVQWPQGNIERIRFEDCYAFDAVMNFGVVAAESIGHAHREVDSPKLHAVRAAWKRVGVELNDLVCFELVMSSTASTIKVYARSFEVAARAEPENGDKGA